MKVGENYEYQHPSTVFKTIQNLIEIDIINGKYPTAAKLPTISEMSEMFGIGKTTAKKVLEELFNDGIITKQQGVGFFVRPNVKVKLKLKHFSYVESQINQIVSEALTSGFDQNQIIECVQNAIHSFKESEPSCK